MDKAADKVLQAMAEAYPDRVDLELLAMVLGCERSALDPVVAELGKAGLACVNAYSGGKVAPEIHGAEIRNSDRAFDGAFDITEAGMAVATGRAAGPESCDRMLQLLEAAALRQLLCARVTKSGLQPRQRRELRESLDRVNNDSLLGAAKIWAGKPVTDWNALALALHAA